MLRHEKRRVFHISSKDRNVGTPEDFTVRVPPIMMPPLALGQVFKLTILNVCIPISRYEFTEEGESVPETTVEPDFVRFTDSQGKQRLGAQQFMLMINTSLSSNSLTPAGFSPTLLSLPLALTFSPSSRLDSGTIAWQSRSDSDGSSVVWYRAIDSLRVWLSTDANTPQPALFNNDWFMTVAFDVVDTNLTDRMSRELSNMSTTMQLMMLSQSSQMQQPLPTNPSFF